MKPRLLIIGTAYAIQEHRKKLRYLSGEFSVTCVTAQHCSGFGWTESTDQTDAGDDFRLIGLPIGGASTLGTRSWYRGLSAVFRDGQFDLILVESEPWAVLRWQSWLLKILFQHRAAFGTFTWENILRTRWKGRILRAIYRAATLTETFAVGGSQDAAALLQAHGSDPKNTFCVPQFGVDPEVFAPLSDTARREGRRRAGLAEDAFLIAYCGRLVPEKGIQDLLDAYRLLTPIPAGLRLVIVGAGVLEVELREISRNDPSIQILPPTGHSQLAQLLQLIDLLVLPSRTVAGPGSWWKEQFGHILIEAMACGVASIGSNSGAIPEVLGDAPMIYPEGDVPRLNALMQSLVNEPDRAKRVGALQRARVLEHFSQQRVAERWAAIFWKVLGNKSLKTPGGERAV